MYKYAFEYDFTCVPLEFCMLDTICLIEALSLNLGKVIQPLPYVPIHRHHF